jgi:hypothetical protein
VKDVRMPGPTLEPLSHVACIRVKSFRALQKWVRVQVRWIVRYVYSVYAFLPCITISRLAIIGKPSTICNTNCHSQASSTPQSNKSRESYMAMPGPFVQY